MRKAYVWRREEIAKRLHADMAEMRRRKDEWWQKYIEAETQEEEDDAVEGIAKINGYMEGLTRAIALLEVRG